MKPVRLSAMPAVDFERMCEFTPPHMPRIVHNIVTTAAGVQVRDSFAWRPVTPPPPAAAAEPICPTCKCAEYLHDEGGFCAGPCGGTCTDPATP